MEEFGKLILEVPDAPDQEYLLSKETISLGRATTNDVVLYDQRTSRSHARIECGLGGCSLVDLGSANGTRLNGQRVERAAISPGDRIQIGGSTLLFQLPGREAEPGEQTRLESESDLDASLDQMTLAMAINDTSRPRLVVHTPDSTWEVQLETDALSIGRQPGNDLPLDYEKISRRHARLERRGGEFFLNDLGSTNGTWLAGVRVDTQRLKSGDSFKIGPVQIVFKDGFEAEALTLMGADALQGGAARRPVVFVPGIMGSELWQGSQRVWPNVKYLFKHPEIFEYSENSPLEPRGLVNEVVIVPNLIKLEQYSRLGDYLVEELGYTRGLDFLEFAYDWRQDVRLSAQNLALAIDAWQVEPPVTIIAHSLGTQVSRYYVERLAGKKKISKLILLGGPHKGVPEIVTSLLLGPRLLPFGLRSERLSTVIATFPSSYQILPTYACAVDQNGRSINMLEDESWVSEAQRPLLRQARQFRQELGTRSSVPTVSIFGYGLKTISGIRIQRDAQGAWQKIAYDVLPGGDSSVPESSSILDGSEIHPVKQYHGTLYVDNDVKMRLKLDLTGGPR